MQTECIYKTKVPYAFIACMIFGVAFFGFLFNSTYHVKQAPGEKIDPETALWIIAGVSSLFAFFAVCCLYGVIGFKIIYLTSDELIIRRPLLMYRRRIYLPDIDQITEKEEIVNLSRGLE